MSLSLHYAAASNVGLRRDGNEDSAYAGPRLLAVADGMGGHAAGEVASAVIIATLATLDDDAPGSDLLAALREAAITANDHLRDMVAADRRLEGMGTTLSALLASGNKLGLVHVGDSRAYLLRDGQLAQITRDHTLVQGLVDEGRLAPEDADSHPQRNFITRALDGRADVELDLSVREARVGDRYLLCTDGLSGVVSGQTMLAEALTLPDPHRAVSRLIELALRGGAPDNVTCIVADIRDGDPIGDGRPIVVGAAEAAGTGPLPSADTPAGRAALAQRALRAPAAPRVEPPRAAASGASRRRPTMLRAAIAGGAVLLLAVIAVVVTWTYLRSQYYVAAGTHRVTIYRGVKGSIAGVTLSSVAARPSLLVSDLPVFDRQRILDGISADSLSDARQIVERLRGDAIADCVSRRNEAPLSPSPANTASSSPAPSSSAASSSAPASARPGPSAAVPASPTPSGPAPAAAPSASAGPVSTPSAAPTLDPTAVCVQALR